MVGSGSSANTKMPTNKLMIWDDELKMVVGDLAFFDHIVDLKVVDKWILVA